MGTATTTTTPESAVEALMKQVADENGLEITENLASVPSQTIGKFMFFWYFRRFLPFWLVFGTFCYFELRNHPYILVILLL